VVALAERTLPHDLPRRRPWKSARHYRLFLGMPYMSFWRRQLADIRFLRFQPRPADCRTIQSVLPGPNRQSPGIEPAAPR
jgi:hypothetical protein